VSDKEKKNIEQVVEEAETSAVAVEEAASTVEEPEPHVAPSPPPIIAQPDPGARAGSSAPAWLALLLVLALAGAAAWSVMEAQRREAQLLGRVVELEGIASQKESHLETNLQALEGRWQTELNAGISALQDESSRQAQTVESLADQLGEVRAELARYGANDRESWLLAEAEYLLRLANQRLIMAGDAASAQACSAAPIISCENWTTWACTRCAARSPPIWRRCVRYHRWTWRVSTCACRPWSSRRASW